MDSNGQKMTDSFAADNLSWGWSASEGSSVVVRDRVTVLFHPTYSSGTAAARGDTGLVRPYHYYWELKMLRPVYGTDVMVGLCTKDMDLSRHSNNFASLVGSDKHSWGYSFHGYLQHGGTKTAYAQGWGKNDIVGVHYDSWRGNIQFYRNRKPLAVAWKGVPAEEMFPVVSSTAAKSEIKLITALSFPNNLQFECFKALSLILPKSDLLNVYIPPGLRNFVRNNYWFLVMNRKCPCHNPDDSMDEGENEEGKRAKRNRRNVKSKTKENTLFASGSEDEEERECFINIRERKLDLMNRSRLNVPENVDHSQCESPSVSSQDQSARCRRAEQNLDDETETATKQSAPVPRIRIKKKSHIKR